MMDAPVKLISITISHKINAFAPTAKIISWTMENVSNALLFQTLNLQGRLIRWDALAKQDSIGIHFNAFLS